MRKTILLATVMSMCAGAAIAQSAHNVQETNIVIKLKDGTRICRDLSTISHLEHSTEAPDPYTPFIKEITDKSDWRVVYATLAEPWGQYEEMFDGKDDAGGWCSHIDDGFDRSGYFGHPFVVIDLGRTVRLGAVGVLEGNPVNNDSWDVFPKQIDFYGTADNVSINISNDDWKVLRGSEGERYVRYHTLHKEMTDYDNTLAWEKIGTINIGVSDPAHIGRYIYPLTYEQMTVGTYTRYIKLDLTPFGPERPGNRSRVFEVYVYEIAE